MQCASCHTGITQRDGLRHDVGTIQASSGQGNGQPLAAVGFDTPTLYGSWSTSAFFHNGQAATLQALFAGGHGNASSLSSADVTALVEYVRSLDATSALLRIRSNANNLCVNVGGASAASGAVVIQWPCGSAANEQMAVNNIDGHLQFVFKHSGLCLAQSNATTTGGPVVQAACSAGTTTQWTVSGAVLRNRGSGACLDVPGGATAQGTELITWACHGGNNQNWTLNTARN